MIHKFTFVSKFVYVFIQVSMHKSAGTISMQLTDVNNEKEKGGDQLQAHNRAPFLPHSLTAFHTTIHIYKA